MPRCTLAAQVAGRREGAIDTRWLRLGSRPLLNKTPPADFSGFGFLLDPGLLPQDRGVPFSTRAWLALARPSDSDAAGENRVGVRVGFKEKWAKDVLQFRGRT